MYTYTEIYGILYILLLYINIYRLNTFFFKMINLSKNIKYF